MLASAVGIGGQMTERHRERFCRVVYLPAAVVLPNVKTRIEVKCAMTLGMPLLVRRLVYSFCFVSTGAEFEVFSPRVAEKGNSNIQTHFSSI